MKLQVLDYIPYQRKMVKENLVTEKEWEMLGSYHSHCIHRMSSECVTDAGKVWAQQEAGAWLH